MPAIVMERELSASDFADRMMSAMRRMRRNILSAERSYLTRGIITLPQLWVLLEIADSGHCPMSSLSRALGLKSSTVTGIMDRLVELKLAARAPSASDRREVLASLTAKGRRILNHIQAEKKRMLVRAFGPLNARERAEYLRIIEKVLEHSSPDQVHRPASGARRD